MGRVVEQQRDAGAGADILVTGATGSVGGKVLSALAAAGHPVRALCRRPEQVAELQARGIRAELGDMGDPETLRAAMTGCDRLFLLTHAGPAQQLHGRNGVEAAQAAGVRHVVHLSTGDTNPDSAIPWAKAPALTDALLRKSGLQWTLLRPSAFMEDLLESVAPIRRGFLPQTSGKGGVGWIDTRDIAAVAVTVLTEPGHTGQDYVLTGPERLSAAELAAQLSSATGRRVRFVQLPGPVFYLLLRLGGSDHWQARGLVHQFIDVVRHGHDGGWVLTDTVQRLTGNPPRTFADYAQDNRAAFSTT